MKQFRASLVFLSAILLTGCASTFYSKISTLNQLPEVLSNKTYTILEHAEQAKEPEYLHASEEIKTRLKELGFEEIDQAKAALKVSMQLISIPGNTHVSSPFSSGSYLITPSGMVIPMGGFWTSRYYPGFINTPYRFYPRSRFQYRLSSPFYSPFPFGNHLHPFYAADLNVRQYVDHGVEIVISDSSSGKVLYSVLAKSTQNDTEIGPYIELLIESALRDFPSKTGESRIEIQLEK